MGLLLLLTLALVMPGLALAQTPEIPASVIANGGGTTSAGSYILSGTVGQSATGSVAAGNYIVGGGFWEAAQQLLGPADSVLAIGATFQVDLGAHILENIFDPATDGVFLRGTFNGWSDNADPLADADGDSIYQLVDSLSVNTTYEYKFWINSAGAPNGGYEGGVGSGAGGNRVLVVADVDILLPVVLFNNGLPPIAVTGGATGISTTAATLHGTVDPNDNNITVTFEYSIAADFTGSTVATVLEEPVTGSDPVAVSLALTGLISDTLYHYHLRVVDHGQAEYVRFGADLTFRTLAPGMPTVTLLSPNGGEVWNEDAVHNIFWQASDDQAVTRIQLLGTADGGVSYVVLFDSLDNDGDQFWRVTRTPTANARIKIVAYDALGQTAVDSSDGFFTIQDVETYIHATGALSHTIRNDGRTGSGSGTFDAGEPSLVYPPASGNSHLFIGQLLLLSVSGTDTIAALPYSGDNYHPETAITSLDQTSFIETKTSYTDKLGLGLRVTEHTFAANNESYVIHAYNIRNNSAASYTQLHAAFFVDLDMNDFNNNLLGYNTGNGLAFMIDPTGGWTSYAGIRTLDQLPSAFRRWGANLGGQRDTPGQLFRTLATPGFDNPGAGPDPAGEYSLAEVLGPLNLAPGDSVTVAFVLAAGADLSGLLSATQKAQDLWTTLNIVKPLATTDPASDIATNSATLNGRVNPQGDATTVEFEWGPTTSYGNIIAADQSPLAAGITVEVAVDTVLSGLVANTTYHYRIRATNTGGETISLDQAFTTQAVAVPSAPANVVMYGGSGAAAITWVANPAVEEVNKYTVYRNTSDIPSTATVIKVVDVPYTHYVDYPATTDREYWYWVTATDVADREGPRSIGASDHVDPPLAHGGGPDTFGYKWIDSDTTGGPMAAFFDITATGIQLNLGDDAFSLVPLPFAFPFYENDYTEIKISSNGYLAFGTEGIADLASNEDQSENELYIPDGAGANNFIAAFWADLNPDPTDGGGTIHYYDDAANNRFIVQYTNVPLFQEPQSAPGKSGEDGASVLPGDKFGSGGNKVSLDRSGSDPQDALIQLSPVEESAKMATGTVSGMATDFTFQVQLYDDGAIMFQYLAMNGLTDAATVGIENSAGDDGLAAVEWDFLVENNYAIGFTPPAPVSEFRVLTLDANSITSDSASLNAEVMPDGIQTDVVFEFWDEAIPGTILEFPSGQNPVNDTVSIIVSAWATGLDTNTTYIFKAKASQVGGEMIEAPNSQSFTTPVSENAIVDVQTITDTGTVEFPSTGVVLDISSFTGSGDDVIEVAFIFEAPTGEIADSLQLLTTTSSWSFDYSGSGSFELEITFELGPGAVPQEYQDEPGRIKLLSRPSGSSDAWEIRTFASAATDHSVTFPDITYFSEFILGTATPDIIAPSITFAGPQATSVGSDLTVTAQVSDDRSTPVVELIYLAGGGGIADTSVRTMQVGNPGEYSYTIPGSEVGFTGLLMQIKAVDGANNDTLTAPLSVPVSYPAETLDSGTLPGMFTSTNGIPDSTWRLFSVPGFLTNSSLSLNIGDELGVESGDFTWKVFAFNSNTGSYAAPSNLQAGVGYWINQRLKSGLNFKLTAGQSKDLEGFEIDMEPETWYLIGNPFPFDLSTTFDGRFFGPITYDGSGWSAEQGTMEPWGGYAVYNRSLDAETLILSAVPAPLLLAKATEPEKLAGWLMHLSVKGEYYTDIANSIGRIKGASEQLDHFDAPEPPFIDGYITLVMERPEWGGNLTALSSDIRSWEETDGTWDLQLRTKNATGPIALTTQLEGDLPAGNKVVLMDLQQRAVYDLTAGEVPADITGYSERYPYYLKVMAGTEEYVGRAVDQALAQLPVDFALAQNYPNPFNPSTRLQYSLTHPAPVSLKIYNLLGREITTLYEGWQDLGRFEVVWNGRDRFGNSVATGIYFAVFRAQGRMYTSKMLLLK